ncbi:PLP-dependent aminotransferase family protein [Gracilibacillus oryzae]|uniref:PLP-dependent aminotransferase family protein n=1 Tax=Gracilibacillus oryzae TaxID=1672701 RepID=A0A7C8GTZ4_9BACI|nr:PLP-dependent aminotransferase family protein [Gracilibacillus oryzae]KAB8135767.1 PLP-dependent aminotransferase family protein [Gracilibacillus oryzae]
MTQTKYSLIYDEIKQRILGGELKSGSKLPSIRQLAEQHACSKNTIIKAYTNLEKQHLIYSIPKSGYFVVNDRYPLVNGSDIDHIDFLSAGPDPAAMPYEDFQHCLNQAINLHKGELFAYSHPQGIPSLRMELTNHLQDRQVFTTSDKICITSGSQQVINLLVSMPFPNGKSNILIEQPTYFGVIESLKVNDVKTFGIERTMAGIDFEKLEYMFRYKDIKFFYTVPSLNNPLGHTYTNSQKKKMVELAHKYDVYIVEDDIFSDLDLNAKSDPMYAYDSKEKVIYVKSFSKITLPGLRIGAVVLPELLKNTFMRFKFSNDLFSSTVSQGALEIYLKSRMFNGHLERIKELYRRKMEIARIACNRCLPTNVRFTEPAAGFYFSIYLPKKIQAPQLVTMLKHRGVSVSDGNRLFLSEFRKGNMIRLCISQVEEEQIQQGIEIIADCLHKMENEPIRFVERMEI